MWIELNGRQKRELNKMFNLDLPLGAKIIFDNKRYDELLIDDKSKEDIEFIKIDNEVSKHIDAHYFREFLENIQKDDYFTQAKNILESALQEYDMEAYDKERLRDMICTLSMVWASFYSRSPIDF